jgi:quercetin dioxygenase-like cupin family protein
MDIRRWNPAQDGLLSEQSLRRKLEGLGYSVQRYVYPPGTCFPPHTHDSNKMDAVLSGQFRITMAGESVVLEAGDAVAVPAGVEHSAETAGDEPVVSLDGVARTRQ